MNDGASKHKDEAVRAILHARGVVLSGRPLDGLDRVTLAATLNYAVEQVGEIVEVKRVRKPKSKINGAIERDLLGLAEPKF